MGRIKPYTSYLLDLKNVHEVTAIVHASLIELQCEDIFILFSMREVEDEQMHSVTFKWTHGDRSYEHNRLFTRRDFPSQFPVECCFSWVSTEIMQVMHQQQEGDRTP